MVEVHKNNNGSSKHDGNNKVHSPYDYMKYSDSHEYAEHIQKTHSGYNDDFDYNYSS